MPAEESIAPGTKVRFGMSPWMNPTPEQKRAIGAVGEVIRYVATEFGMDYYDVRVGKDVIMTRKGSFTVIAEPTKLSEELAGMALEWLGKYHNSGDDDRYAKGVSDAYTDSARRAAEKGQ
jgi:hypothetical protein